MSTLVNVCNHWSTIVAADVDNSVALMVQKITNTKLKAIRVYHKAQELKGGVKFRDQRRVEAGIQFKKMKEEMDLNT